VFLQFLLWPSVRGGGGFRPWVSTAGVVQLGRTLVGDVFPGKKGVSTAFVTLSSSIAFFVIPYVTGLIDRHIGVSFIFLFEILIALVALGLAMFISDRYKKVFNITDRKRMLHVNTDSMQKYY